MDKNAMITIAGRPNVGKSTLTNALVGEKVAIVSNKPQTTRNRITAIINRGDTQLVLMDIALPFFDGYHWCAEIRKISTAPILFISSAGDNLNILRALDAGADDFVSKPFDLSVLLAKVQALLRRAYAFAGQSALLTCGDLMLNASDGAVTCRGQRAELTRNENRILTVLMENKGKIVSRDALMARLWETDAFVDENTLSVNITRLRRKLAAVGAEDLIKTRKGMGYLIE